MLNFGCPPIGRKALKEHVETNNHVQELSNRKRNYTLADFGLIQAGPVSESGKFTMIIIVNHIDSKHN